MLIASASGGQPVNPYPTAARGSLLAGDSAVRPGNDPIFALHAQAQARAAAGDSVLNLTIGALCGDDGELAILPSVQTVLQSVPPRAAAAYAAIPGDAPFRAAVIADLYGESDLARRSVAVATPGGTGAIHHAIVNFLEPGQAALTTSYYWGPYATLAEHTRHRLECFDMFDSAGAFNLAAFEAAVDRQLARQKRILCILNSPCHNPTGYSLDESEWKAVGEILMARASAAPVALLVDLAYERFGSTGGESWHQHVSGLAEEGVLLVAWTVSKAFAQYGARIGALVATQSEEEERKRIFNALSYSCRGTWSNCNHLGMLAATKLLSDPELRRRSDQEREKLRDLLAERVAAFHAEASRAHLRYPRYEGGFFVSVFTPDAELTAAAMREQGVYVVPLVGAVRVALCATARADVPRLVQALASGVRAAEAR
jgi:aromatic-amino-acid transaminase